MKTLLIFLSMLTGVGCWGQEFTVHDNGLIYSDHSVGKLKRIVDSLNLKFKVCDANKVYYSMPQAMAHYVYLEKNQVREAKADMERGISFEDFIKKYNTADHEKRLLVVRTDEVDYEDNKMIVYRSPELRDGDGHNISFKQDSRTETRHANLKGKWLFEYERNNRYNEEYIRGFYFLEDFESKPLAKNYSRMVQYSECLVDTTAQVFHENAVESGVRFAREEKPNKISHFIDYVDKATAKPQFDYELYNTNKKTSDEETEKREQDREVAFNTYYNALQQWDSTRIAKLDFMKVHDAKFNRLLQDAISDAKNGAPTYDEFEFYVSRYASMEAALEMKRNRHVIGGCSQDRSPRVHAMNIAVLSAETTKWEIFLRSHLDIMNDRFARVSDGSYAYGARQTYIRELEVLDINVPDLIFGISLRVGNPAANHYFGSLGRIGRALSESADAKNIESSILGMIADNNLDDYNRILMYYLFDNYNYHLTDETSKAQNIERLKTAVAQMPDHIASRIKVGMP